MRSTIDRSHSARPAASLVGMVVSVSLLAGCSASSDDGPESAQSATSSEATALVGPQATVPESKSLFTQYFSAYDQVYAQATEDRAAIVARHEQVEDSIAQCMKKQGFEYYPREPLPEAEEDTQTQPPLRVPYLSKDRDEVATTGYGIEDPTKDTATEHLEDPNAVYVLTLNPSALEAYGLALGHRIVDEETGESETRGCSAEADTLYPPPDQPQPRTGEFDSLIAAMGAVQARHLEEEPKVVELNQEWTQCMSNAGYHFTEYEIGGHVTLPDPYFALGLAATTAPGGAVFEGHPDMPAEDIPWEHRALMGSPEEIAIALDDFDCRNSTNYLPRLFDILTKMEQAFIDNNRTALNELLQAAETN